MARTVDNRPLHLKFRLEVTRRMPKSEAVRLLRQAIRTGYVPNGIRIHWLDWVRGREGHLNQGSIPGDQWHDLQNFYGVLKDMDLRAEKVDRSDEG